MKNSKLAALRAAFPYTVPIFAGFWFRDGLWHSDEHVRIFLLVSDDYERRDHGGSLEFVAVSMLLSIAGGTIVYMILIRVVF